MSNRTEQDVLRRFGIRPHKNSGRGLVKGDGSDSMFVWDVKESHKSVALSHKMWRKICTDAYKVDPSKYPGLLLSIEFGRTELAVVEMEALMFLRDEVERLNRLVVKLNDDIGDVERTSNSE